ncbi:mitotic fidelity of chromosome transmission- protein [Exophiala xenobiotica]|nr:mitotic fidelity of chromosome transmission- protein [Exophiala xenobiotica]
MAPRASVRVGREDVNYSAVGKLGRRTGVALEQRPLDANGMEEITGIFSSPRKPSPLKNMTVMESVEEAGFVKLSKVDSRYASATSPIIFTAKERDQRHCSEKSEC